MKKLLALAIFSAFSLAKPCFGVDWIRDKIYTSQFTNFTIGGQLAIGKTLGYHFTDNTKVEVGLLGSLETAGIGGGAFTSLHYHHKIEGTDITPYVSIGTGIGFNSGIKITEDKINRGDISSIDFLYKINAGINLPLSSRTNVFAGYSFLRVFGSPDHGLELGMSFNL